MLSNTLHGHPTPSATPPTPRQLRPYFLPTPTRSPPPPPLPQFRC
jgi:hypothetical protein